MQHFLSQLTLGFLQYQFRQFRQFKKMDYSQSTPIAPLFINSCSLYSIWGEICKIGNTTGSNGAMASLSWPAAARAIYVPLEIPFPYNVRRVFWGNGSTAGSNVDVGIYNWDGTKLFSTGSTVQVGTSVMQYASLGTDITLFPGRYYFGIVYNGTTNLAWGLGAGTLTASRVRLAGLIQQAAAFPLPQTIVPAVVGAALYPLVGMTSTSS